MAESPEAGKKIENDSPLDLANWQQQEIRIRLGGGQDAIRRQHEKNRLTARERIAHFIDQGTFFLEIGLWASWNMYRDWGGAPSAGVVTGIGIVQQKRIMIIANDATVKAGSFFPMTCKKVLRAQRIAMENSLPLVYLVDSAGVFLPLQDEIFPDEDDFGRIFRNNAVISAKRIPQFAAIMGNCVAGGGYLPVLCDHLLMTEGSGLYLAGPALVKAAIGQTVDSETLGGASMHASISGTIDFREKDDLNCLQRLRQLITHLPELSDSTNEIGKIAGNLFLVPSQSSPPLNGETVSDDGTGHNKEKSTTLDSHPSSQPEIAYLPPVDVSTPRNKIDKAKWDKFVTSPEYDVRELIELIIDENSPFDEVKQEYGQTIVCGYAHLGGQTIGIVANQHQRCKTASGMLQYGSVIYVDSADKTARFIMDCNQLRCPLLFLQNVNGFMVGKQMEQSGIIRAGAALVNVISNSVVPKITLITGGSFGAGNYAMCGKAFDPRLIYAWPTARYAVMGGEQAANTLLDITLASLKRAGQNPEADELIALKAKVKSAYEEQMDIRHGAARLWVDRIIQPEDTRMELLHALAIACRAISDQPMRVGVLQV